ncbi:type 1 glutamine amidotransferase-like domain-containing protein [Leptobacterium flavescens]|uniref:Type 1 glutamine amidotransferase-like domain-containing protein n=1 Tax=Leptobacterium flavescens TaxID=472055 RepID=A0A6P0UTD8_9FLAO|nr:Type 1 glutamine amidotransferase-like domain-containing protein [Leptobacterium flavescens]NER15109.1 type 1 glutamine amidotransferase-like domain-containing protein [Leptobacterium flavescens]
MKYYLSSYKFGNQIKELKRLIPQNNKIGHINNSRDWVGADPERVNKHQQEEIELLNEIGFKAEPLDLKEYFNKTEELKSKLNSLGGIWVSGGNTFVLRMAMKLSGFDRIFKELITRNDFLYGGYSAGICILSDSLKSIDIVDDPNNFPYKGINKPIYEGLGVFNYSFMPHYDSDHFESEAIGKEIQRCIDNKWLFKALRDGEVIIVE